MFALPGTGTLAITDSSACPVNGGVAMRGLSSASRRLATWQHIHFI